jgi:hypothetical protein
LFQKFAGLAMGVQQLGQALRHLFVLLAHTGKKHLKLRSIQLDGLIEKGGEVF